MYIYCGILVVCFLKAGRFCVRLPPAGQNAEQIASFLKNDICLCPAPSGVQNPAKMWCFCGAVGRAARGRPAGGLVHPDGIRAGRAKRMHGKLTFQNTYTCQKTMPRALQMRLQILEKTTWDISGTPLDTHG